MTPVLLAVVLAGLPEHAASRSAPPAAVGCPRDRLTSYTGRVVSYRRSTAVLSLSIRTDWNTTERVRLAPPALNRMRLAGMPFTTEDWTRLEMSPDEPRPGLRATAWVCDDGPPLIDWQPADAGAKSE
jgi:hypothetical protein